MESVEDTEVESEEELAEVTVAVAEFLPVTAPPENPDLTKQQIPTQSSSVYHCTSFKTIAEMEHWTNWRPATTSPKCFQCLWKHNTTSPTYEERQWHTWKPKRRLRHYDDLVISSSMEAFPPGKGVRRGGSSKTTAAVI